MRPRFERGPRSLTVVRHAHSAGNRANALALAAGALEIGLDRPDMDVELTATGHEQVAALARWVRDEHGLLRPDVVLSSPYRRTTQTAGGAVRGLGLTVGYDERLREREAGALAGLTPYGIRQRRPEEVRRRDEEGELAYRPPGGESWYDVARRVGSLLDDLRDGYDGARVWVVTHQAVVMAFRLVLEGLSERRLLQVDRGQPLPNASLTSYRRTGGVLELVRFADTSPLGAVEVTDETSPGRLG